MNAIAEAMSHIPPWAGSVPGWIMALAFLGILWKGLPAVLDAWSNSVAREREHREREIKRLETQIAASDQRHENCMEGQTRLQDELERMRVAHADEIIRINTTHAEDMQGLRNLVTGLMAQIRQIQFSGAGVMIADLPPEMASLLHAIDDNRGIKQ